MLTTEFCEVEKDNFKSAANKLSLSRLHFTTETKLFIF